MNIGYERTLHANETVQEAEQAIRKALLGMKKVMEDKPAAHQWEWEQPRARWQHRLQAALQARTQVEEGVAQAEAQAKIVAAREPSDPQLPAQPVGETALAAWQARIAEITAAHEVVLETWRAQSSEAQAHLLEATNRAHSHLPILLEEEQICIRALQVPCPWAGKTVRFTVGPRFETTVTPLEPETLPDGTTQPRARTVVTGTWDYEVM